MIKPKWHFLSTNAIISKIKGSKTEKAQQWHAADNQGAS
jgi:hypothetical protein